MPANPKQLARRVYQGERSGIARAITLVESTRQDHRRKAAGLLAELGSLGAREGLRIGITGAPGAGKSTLIDCLGTKLTRNGLSVAVLAVDPSSTASGGSILGDKTRMSALVRNPKAFIRPSPTGGFQGGVSRRARDVVFVCEQAGFDVVLVETTGVGQTDILVSGLVDIFVLLVSPGAGDDLQGIKRGIMEKADLVLVNKSDGEFMSQASRTCADYASALRLLRSRRQDPDGFPVAMNISALEDRGIQGTWKHVLHLAEWRRQQGFWRQNRQNQAVSWFKSEIDERIRERLLADEELRARISAQEDRVRSGRLHYDAAAQEIVEELWSRVGQERVSGSQSVDNPQQAAK